MRLFIMAKERLTPIERIEKLNQKINKLKQQQKNVQKTFETKIITLLKKENMFHHDFNILYGAILDICEKIKNPDHNKTSIDSFLEKGQSALSKKKRESKNKTMDDSQINDSRKVLKPKYGE